MKRIILPMLAAAALCPAAQLRAAETADGRTAHAAAAAAERPDDDSLRIYRMQEIEVTATRATEKTPVASRTSRTTKSPVTATDSTFRRCWRSHPR